jgi:phage terminase small subunit
MTAEIELRQDEDGVSRFHPLKKSGVNVAHRYNRLLEEWVTSGSLAEALRRAGYRPERVVATGQRIKKNHPEILEEVRRRRVALSKKIELNQEAVVLELARLAFADIGRIVAWEDGKPTIFDSDVIDADTMAAIQEISTNADGQIKIKMYDKRGALVDLGKFMGLGGNEGAHLAALLARLAGASDGEVLEAQRMDGRETARRVALLLRKGRALVRTPQS